jgi:hypothetical protein
MRPEAHRLGQALLDHHRRVVAQHPPRPSRDPDPARYTIRYSTLCNQAGVPHVVRIVGAFLGELAEWCSDEGLPPLNSLAVGESGQPGEGYDGAGGFKSINWVYDVVDCIRCDRYPQKMP